MFLAGHSTVITTEINNSHRKEIIVDEPEETVIEL